MEEKEADGGCRTESSWQLRRQEDKEAAAADSRRHPAEPGPVASPDGRTHLAAEAAGECVEGSFRDTQAKISTQRYYYMYCSFCNNRLLLFVQLVSSLHLYLCKLSLQTKPFVLNG